jgi:hypothetical protein
MDRREDAPMRTARIGLFAPALLMLSLMVQPEPAGRTTVSPLTNQYVTAPAPLRQVAHDFAVLEMKEQTVAPPRRPEILAPPKPDANPGRMTQTPPKVSRPDEIMVGPDGVIYRRLPPGNSADRR